MKLLVAHQILIGSAIGLSAIFGVRALVLYLRDGGASLNLVLALVALGVGAALGVYLRSVRARWLREKQLGAPRGR